MLENNVGCFYNLQCLVCMCHQCKSWDGHFVVSMFGWWNFFFQWYMGNLGSGCFKFLSIMNYYKLYKGFFFFFNFFLWLILCGMLLLETEPSWGNLSTFLDGCLGIRIVHSLNSFKFFGRGILLLVYGGSLRS